MTYPPHFKEGDWVCFRWEDPRKRVNIGQILVGPSRDNQLAVEWLDLVRTTHGGGAYTYPYGEHLKKVPILILLAHGVA